MLGIDIRQMNLYFTMAIVALLPFAFLLSPVIGLWVIWQLANYKNVRAEGVFKNGWVLLSLLFFLLHAAAAFFSHDRGESLSVIEIKLSFLIFPFLLYFSGFDQRAVKRISGFFLLSVSISLLVCLLHAVYLYFTTDKGFVTYNDFSWFLHPSYLAMYIVFALLILFVNDVRFSSNTWLHWFMLVLTVVLLVAGLLLCASKMGMLTFAALVPVLIFVLLWRNRKQLLAILFIVAAAIAGFVLLRSDLQVVARFRNAFVFAGSTGQIDKTTSESNAVRILIWTEAVDLIKEKPVLGFTPGDVNNQLYEAYEEHGLSGALGHHLNAHNQYLQTTLGLGLIGGMVLLALTLGLVVAGIIRKNALLTLFGLLIVLNFAVESMLQTQAGTLFFVFFFALLAISGQAGIGSGGRSYKR